MALVASGEQGSPTWEWQLHATQTGGSGNSRTVKVEMWIRIKNSGSRYGYPLQWKGRVNSSYSGWIHVKGNETWSGGGDWKKYSWTQTVDVGTTSSKAITVGFQLDMTTGSSSVEMTKTGSFTVGITNTKPYFTSGEQWLRIKNGSSSGAVLSGTIPENVNTVYMDWGYASDKEGGTLTYTLQRQENGGGWTTVDTGTNRAHSESFSGGQGTSRRYWVTVKDSTGAQAETGVYSATIKKNVLTGGRFTGYSGGISFSTTSFRADFGGGKNANGATIEYSCYSDDITIHNQKWTTSGNQTITIWRSGSTPSTPYIKWNDLKTVFAKKGYTGSLHVGLRTRNLYGSIKYASGSVSVDIRKAPNAATNVVVQRNSNSTAWTGVHGVGEPPQPIIAHYLRPYKGTYVQLRWTKGSTALGESFTQVVQFGFSDESWQDLVTLDSGATSYNHYMPEQSKQRVAEYRVITRSSLGSAYSGKASSTVDYYTEGKIGEAKLKSRGETTAVIEWTHPVNTSMSAIDEYTAWSLVGTSQSGMFNGFSSKRSVTVTGLSPGRSYTFEVRFDARNAPGGAHGRVVGVTIPKQTPIFFVNQYGIGIKGQKASVDNALVGQGNIGWRSPNGRYGATIIAFKDGSTDNGMGIAIGAGGSTIIGGGESHITTLNGLSDPATEHMYVCSDNEIWFHSNVQDGVGSAKKVAIGRDGSIFIDNGRVIEMREKTPTWKSLMLWRENQKVEYGVGQWSSSPSVYTATIIKEGGIRLDVGNSFIAQTPATSTGSNWYGFYNALNTGRTGYIGKAANNNSQLTLRADIGELHLLSSYAQRLTLDTGGYFKPQNTNGWALGTSAVRWSTLYYTNLNAASDRKLKENIEYLDEKGRSRNAGIGTKDFYDFIKADLRLAYYDYRSEHKTDRRRSIGKLGFIADDVVDTKVGSLLIERDVVDITEDIVLSEANEENPMPTVETKVIGQEEVLSYDPTSYINILVGAFQEMANKVETLEREIEVLRASRN